MPTASPSRSTFEAGVGDVCPISTGVHLYSSVCEVTNRSFPTYPAALSLNANRPFRVSTRTDERSN